MTTEIAMSGLAATTGLVAYQLIRLRRPRQLAATIGILITATGVAAAYWLTEPEGLGGLGHTLIRGSLLVFVVLPTAIAAAALEIQHRRRRLDE